MKTFLGIKTTTLPAILFQVKCDRGYYLLSHRLSNNDDHSIIDVNPRLFIQFWKESFGHTRDVAWQNPNDWKYDYKFHHAEDGFQAGVGNPVPLADVSTGYNPHNHFCLDFTNGVTRTIWLLYHHVEIMPIRVSTKNAVKIHKKIGFTGHPPRMPSEFLKYQ